VPARRHVRGRARPASRLPGRARRSRRLGTAETLAVRDTD
jgi:hypothetical protein